MNATKIVAGALSLSAVGLVAIANFEGFSSVAYEPVPGDKLTIGFGSTGGVSAGDTISVPEALDRLEEDTSEAESAVRECVKVPLTQKQFDAFTSLAFNIGKKAFCSSTLVKKINTGDEAGACAEIKRWTCGPDPTGQYAAQSPGHKCGPGKAPLPGLISRREAEYRMCMDVE